MLIWLLSDCDTGKFAAFKNLLNSFSAQYPDIKVDFRAMTRRSMWASLFAHLRDSKNRESADVMEIPHSWTAVFAKLGRGPYSFLLESVVGGEKWAAYSFAAKPAASLPPMVGKCCFRLVFSFRGKTTC